MLSDRLRRLVSMHPDPEVIHFVRASISPRNLSTPHRQRGTVPLRAMKSCADASVGPPVLGGRAGFELVGWRMPNSIPAL